MVPVNYTIHAQAPLPFYCHISVFEGDGSIAVSHGGIEMGQGMYYCTMFIVHDSPEIRGFC